MASNEKLPPIVVAPEGFEAMRPMGADGEADAQAQMRALAVVARLPAFQRFILTRATPPAGMPVDQFAFERACAALADDATFMAQYEQWHAAQGRWPNETPYGELMS